MHRRRTRTMITGLLTALVWVWSLLQAPAVTAGTQREIERALTGSGPAVAVNSPSVRVDSDGASRQSSTHAPGAAATAPVAPYLASPGRASTATTGERDVASARFRISPHDATAPPAALVAR